MRFRHQLVVGQLVGRSRVQFGYLDHLVERSDGRHVGANAHVEAEAFVEGLWSLQQQVRFVFDDAAHEVREPAVGVTDVAAAFEHDDLHIGVETT